jgi:predicted TIM-barrel fold metal-dependent hydrolase
MIIPRKFKTINVHEHVRADEHGELNVSLAQELLHAADLLGIDRLCVSLPSSEKLVDAQQFHQHNNVVWQAMQLSPRFLGFCFVNPRFPAEALKEIELCISQRKMSGIKLYHQHFIDADEQREILELAAQLAVPVLVHAGKCTDPGTIAAQPRLSNAGHFLQALRKFPNTIFIQGHIGGGGDWEWNLRTLEGVDSHNYYLDISGSVIDSGMIRRCVETIGSKRLLFATDGSLEEGVGKLVAAKLSEEEMRQICHDNFMDILKRRKV